MTQRQGVFCFIAIKPSTIEFRVSRDAKKNETQAVVLCSGSNPYQKGNVDNRLQVLSIQLSRLVHDYRIDEIEIQQYYK